MSTADLKQVLLRAQRHDPEALDELVRRYSGRVFGLLYRLTGRRDEAEDLVQETFLRVVRRIGEYEHAGRFEPWLFRIAANLARDRARQLGRRGEAVSLDDDTDGVPRSARQPGSAGSPADRLDQEEAGARLAEALEQLNDAEREIILLRHYSGLSFRDIAELLELPLGTALARAHRALQKLRGLLAEE